MTGESERMRLCGGEVKGSGGKAVERYRRHTILTKISPTIFVSSQSCISSFKSVNKALLFMY
jgi:hypothetical protein